MSVSVLDFDSRIVTDKEEIAKYDKEFDYNFFTPHEEHKAIDKDIVIHNVYTESRKSINKELSPIYVAVNPQDPFKSVDNPIRVHGRIIDGNHRYQDSIKAKVRWSVVYFRVNSYKDFMRWWSHMTPKKNTASLQTQQKIIDYCNFVWTQEGDRTMDENKIPQKQKVGAIVKNDLMAEGQLSKVIIYRYMPEEFKDKRKQGKKNRQPKISKSQKKINTLEKELQDLHVEIDQLKELKLTPTKKDEKIKFLNSQLSQQKITISNIKSYVRKELQKKMSDTDFEQWWQSFSLRRIIS